MQLTNILLGVLISLITTIAMIGYNKMETFSKELRRIAEKIEAILIADVGSAKDITQLQKDMADHEERILTLENKVK